jgi:serine/threonine protein kinase
MEKLINFEKKRDTFNSLENNDDFDYQLESFLQNNDLILDIPDRRENVEVLKNSVNKEFIGDYVIANDFKLKTEGAKITLAYKNNDDKLLVVKEMKEEKMKELGRLNQWGNLTVEGYLKENSFNNPNVLLPDEIIEKEGNIYRFYEAMDMDLEKYLESHNKLSVKDSILLIIKVCSGVRALNELGVANVDLAPLNIMLTKRNIKIIDLDGASIDTDEDGIFGRDYLGTNRFTSAPELFEKRPVFDKTVDTYAASANLYRLICGDWPHNIEAKTRELKMSYEDKMEAFKKEHLSGDITFPNDLPDEIIQIIKKGMNPTVSGRYQSMEYFISDLIRVNNEKLINNNMNLETNITKEVKKVVLPDSFKIEISREFGSSGGDRKYKATLVFVDGKVTEGEALLETLEGGGRRGRVSSKIVNGEWGNKEGGDICDWENFNNFLTKEGIQNEIDSGEMIQSNKSLHLTRIFKVLE